MTQWDTAQLPKPTRDLARLKADIDEWGYCLIAEAYTPAEIAAFKARLAEQAAGERNQGHHKRSYVQDPGGINQWMVMLINKGEMFRRHVHHPIVNAVVKHVLGEEYVLSEISSHITRPGAQLLPLHTDQWWLPVPTMPGESYVKAGDVTRTNVRLGPPARSKTPINPPLCVNAMCMVTDFTEENGATRLVPGSHLSGVQPDPVVPHPASSVPAAAPAGSVVIWDGRMWHAAGGNRSNGERYGLVTMYGGPQMRTLQNFTLGTKQEVLDDASPELLRLLGFKVWLSYGQTGETREGGFAKPGRELIGELKA
jgi:ectoine hydroxylase-related dioxygenase (phytanoyl-CoA dioxygenase family)